MESTIKSKGTIGRHGIFGSTSERMIGWDNHHHHHHDHGHGGMDRIEYDDHIVPGPGAYEQSVQVTSGHLPNALPSAAFKSSSARFQKTSCIPNAPPHVHVVGDTTVPAVGQYDISRSFASTSSSIGSPKAAVIHDSVAATSSASHSNSNSGGAGDQEPVVAKVSAPFLTTSERTGFLSKQAMELPGPGTYDTTKTIQETTSFSSSTRSKDVRTTIGNDRRFKQKPVLPEHIGPGAYSIPSTMGKKSFNVTLASNENNPPSSHTAANRPSSSSNITKSKTNTSSKTGSSHGTNGSGTVTIGGGNNGSNEDSTNDSSSSDNMKNLLTVNIMGIKSSKR
jgi:hypothetical protein